MTAGEREKEPADAAAFSRAPLAEAMRAYREAGALAFHTPGHKQGLGAHRLLRERITQAGLAEEVSLMQELDDLHGPEGCIKEAQECAARLFGADAAFFMVNGTTGAIHAMLLAALSPGDAVLLPRNAHRSVWGGLVLAGARPIYIESVVDAELGIAHGLSTASVRAAVAAHPEAKALLLVSPTYYGVASDIRAIAEIVHGAGLLLLVDEAHGAHLAFSEELPPAALAAGADMAAQSTHKLLGAMTQASLLLLREGRLTGQRVQAAMSLLTTTSPNYLLLASLDIARCQMEEEGRALLARALRLARHLRREIDAIEGLACFGTERMGGAGAYALDELKLTVTVAGLGLKGPEAASLLRHRHKIEAELADERNVLFLITYADTEETAGRLLEALRAMAREVGGVRTPGFLPPVEAAALPPVPPLALTPREAFYRRSAAVPFHEAVGRIAAEGISFYPPGIPVICPGELFTAEVCAYIRAMQEAGLKAAGAEDAALAAVRVAEEEAKEAGEAGGIHLAGKRKIDHPRSR